MSKDDTQTRRRFLKGTGGAAGALLLAGCSGGGNNDTTTGGGDTSSEDTSASTTESTSARTTEGEDTAEGTTGEEETSEETGTSSGGEPQQGGTLQEINSAMTTLDPIRATDEASSIVIEQLIEGLTKYPNALTEAQPQLASGYETNDDFTEYTFSLKDATFHNGDDLTASDIVYSFRRLAESEQSRRASFILTSLGVTHETDSDDTVVPDTLGVEASGEKELTMTLSAAFAPTLEILAYTSFGVVPEGIVGDIEGYDGQIEQNELATSNPVGTGPFTLGTWDKGSSATIERYEDYHDQVPYLDGVEWSIIEDPSAVHTYSMNHNADIFGIPTSYYQQSKTDATEEVDAGGKVGTYGPLENGETANYYRLPGLTTYYLGFNMKAVPKPVRQAFAYVANQQQYVQSVFKNRGSPAVHLTPPALYPGGASAAEEHRNNNYPYGFDQTQTQQATQVMEDAGYSESDPFEVTVTHYVSDTWNRIVQLLQQSLRPAHIRVSIKQARFDTLTQNVRQGNSEVYSLGWGPDYPEADNFLQLLNPPQTDTSKPAPVSGINWSSETGSEAQTAADAYQKVLNNLQPTDDAESARNEAYVTIEEANWEDVGFLNLYNSLEETFWYDGVHFPPYGAMARSTQQRNEYWKEQ